MNNNRVRILKFASFSTGPVVYFMNRDQRINDNWALLYAHKLAISLNVPLFVLFCIDPKIINTGYRQYSFMIEGLKLLPKLLRDKNINFYLLVGSLENEFPKFIDKYNISAIISDFSPLRINKFSTDSILKKIKIPFYEVDSHNIVPCWFASSKQEWSAYTFRPKINRLLDEFLVDFPKLSIHPYCFEENNVDIDWDKITATLNLDYSVHPVVWLKAGEESAKKMLDYFIDYKLDKYAEFKNNPTLDYQSNLSPFLHFGQISAQRVAIEVLKSNKNPDSKKVFLEELIIRRELADNFCFYNSNYDNFNAFPDWAKKTLNEHREDIRAPLFNINELETAVTSDKIWNACQFEMIKTGKMHGYMRMYWAKKILEWTKSPEEALKIAIYLNDKYELDGCDANGYTGIAWSIGGVHDRAWASRMVFGKIRYMNSNGLKRKFNIDKYIEMQNI